MYVSKIYKKIGEKSLCNEQQTYEQLIKHSSGIVLFSRQIELRRTLANTGSVTRTLFEKFKCL